jgi:hypothetical protein
MSANPGCSTQSKIVSTNFIRLLHGQTRSRGNPKLRRGFGETEVAMDNQKSDPNQDTGHQEQGRDIVIPAIRHVGPTLESEETTEGQQLADAVSSLQDANSGTSPYEPRPASALVKDRNEPLRTRLPGDTSSEPHTDVGPDNATSLQHRGEDSTS